MRTIGTNRVSKSIGCCGLFWLAFSGATQANNAWYVATNATHTFSGTSWSTAFTNIQEALDAAQPDDTIYLAGHTFALTTQLVWAAGKDNIKLLGGYEGTGTPGTYDPDQWPTVITRDSAYETRLLFIDDVEDAGIARITFTGGNPFRPTDISAGGAMVVRNTTDFLIRDVLFTENTIEGQHNSNCFGGALHVLNSSGTISNTVFMANKVLGRAGVGYGGGVNISGGSVALHDLVFLGNRSRGYWASESTRRGYGGGISFHGGNHTLRNALLFLNQSRRHTVWTAADGSGIYVWNNATVAIDNTTVYGHSSEGLFIVSGNVTVEHSIFARNNPDIGGAVAPASLSHSLVGDGSGGGTVNVLTGDPGFDEEWFYLAPDSPCRNAGNGTVAAAGLTGTTVSTDGTPESAEAIVSLGYHYPPGAVLAPIMEYTVSETGDDNDAGDAANPFRTIARALQAPGERVRIHLLPGAHDSAGDFPVRIENRGTVQIVGADPETTFIDGQNVVDTRLFEIRHAYGNNRIHGVTLRNGGGSVAEMDGIRAGGAIFLGRARLTIEDCVLEDNIAKVGGTAGDIRIQTLGGGALGAKQAALDIRQTTFRENETWQRSGGGAILSHSTVGVIENCVFQDNVIDSQTGPGGHNRSAMGGALHLARSCFDIRDTVLTGNKAISSQGGESAGGALFQGDGQVTLQNVVFANNQLTNNLWVNPLYGAAIYQFNPGSAFVANRFGLIVENNTIVGNYGDGNDYGHGLFGHDDYVGVVNTILWQNHPTDFTNLTEAAFSHSRADGLTPDVNGNLIDDPVLIDWENGDFGLQTRHGQFDEDGKLRYFAETSPCIDAGINRDWMDEATDLRGFPRISRGIPRRGTGPRVDMGAIEVRIPPTGTFIFMR